jgi:organic hydroperoxide reductase OsmC/OhrA
VSSAAHLYTARCSWSGSTADGYEGYDRTHLAEAAPAQVRLELSSGDPGVGDPGRLNPEQLVVMAAASCQLLWFLHVAAKARLDVREYTDQAEGVMPSEDLPVRLTRIVLRPHIVLGSGPAEQRVRELIDLAHRHCYIANSLRSEVVIEPRIEFGE